MAPRYGLPWAARLRRRGDFVRAYEEGTKVVRHPLVLFARRSDRDGVRLGITATRKIGNAVTRNRAKRLVREAYRCQPLRECGGWDLVVVVRPRLLQLHPDALGTVLREAAVAGMRPCA